MEPDHSVSVEEEESRPGGMRRVGRFTVKIALILGGLFFLFVLGMMLISSFTLEGIASAQQSLERADAVLIWLRLMLIGSLIGFWRPINIWLAQRNAWPQVRLVRVLDGRWMTLGVLLFVELILVQRLHELLIARVVN